ncbi:MAG TPA: F0F1 ATP synthase subunit B [Anaerolineales bacterium]
MQALGINLGYLIVQILNFAILFVVLRAWVYKPIVGMLEKRRLAIEQGLEDAKVAAEARANAEKAAEDLLAEARKEASRLVRAATERAEQAAAEVKAQAEHEAEEVRKGALAEGEKLKEQALGELRGQVAALAIAAAQKIIGEALDDRRQRALIQEFFSGVTKGKVVVLEGQALKGESAEVTSALPLTPEEQAIVKKEIVDKLGAEIEPSYRVDPSILGGLVVRVGDRVIDGSVAARLTTLGQNLQ